ncbi:MAG: HigA family addiction module antidote protein [Gemmatimonadetes bacterium]|nr:HigA family addiction module antidote protein [Gemmatimonadota bacterium]MYK66679.1 HigA family addiction module antidote protein [Gemmatimonadota bacterium]
MPMTDPPHPGLSVRYDCLEPLGLTVTEAARGLGVSRKQLSDIVNGRSGISPVMAIRLDKAFGVSVGSGVAERERRDEMSTLDDILTSGVDKAVV